MGLLQRVGDENSDNFSKEVSSPSNPLIFLSYFSIFDIRVHLIFNLLTQCILHLTQKSIQFEISVNPINVYVTQESILF